MADFARARKLMVDTQLRTNSVTDRRILSAMGRIPRERFVPELRRPLAYLDDDHKLTEGPGARFLAAPTPFGRLIQLAEVSAGDTVLDVGCGTGYSAAVLAQLAGNVVAIEEDDRLVVTARELLSSLEVGNAEVLRADFNQGVPGKAPFDVIVLEGAVNAVPEALFGQLREHGRLVALIRDGLTATAHLYVRTPHDIAVRREFNARMPVLQKASQDVEFVF